MYIDPEITHLKNLILSGKTEEARGGLLNLLQNNPYHDQAWTLAAQFTSDTEQRKIFVKRVFDCSNDMELADWGFQNFGKLEIGLEREISAPPNEYLVIQNHKRIPLDDLVDIALNPPDIESMTVSQPVPQVSDQPDSKPVEPIAPYLSSQKNQNKTQSKRVSLAVNEPMMESTLPLYSLRTIGKWTIVAAGVFLIALLYSPRLLFFFMQFGIYPFYVCVLPMFFIGIIITVAGYLIEKK